MTLFHQDTADTATPLGIELGGPVRPARGALRPLNQSEVRIVGDFWGDYQKLNATVIIEHCETWMERIGWLGNFDRVADGSVGSTHSGIEFVDSEVYKLLEAMAWELGRADDPALRTRYRQIVERVAAAQDPDGYLHTSFGHEGQRARYSDLEWGHELYSFGHLIQAAVARLRTGHDDELPAVARRLADHVYSEFGPTGREAVCGHPEIEPALAEFSRATGDARYLELARLFVERRGTGTLKSIDFGQEYFQDDVPIRDATVLRGHAVRALYLAAGAFDVAVETGDDELAEAIRRQWAATVASRTYITGAVGSHHRDEAFGADFELPPDRAYAETCAGIASVMLSWRLLLDSGEAHYGDLIERTLLNNVLASPRADGHAFYYTNTLQQRVEGDPAPENEISARALSSLRAPWFEVSCCPTNVARTLASVSSYFATTDATGLQLHQYGSFDVRTAAGDSVVALSVRSGYPLDGTVVVAFDGETSDDFTLSFRIPAWATSEFRIDAGEREVRFANGWAVVSGAFLAGESLVLTLPMQARVSVPSPRIDAVRGQVAIERGPLVLALESVDLPDGVDTEHVSLVPGTQPVTVGSDVFVRLEAQRATTAVWPYGKSTVRANPDQFDARLLPYFEWANRGPSTMRVFLPVD
jgi:DUF1680 family protein